MPSRKRPEIDRPKYTDLAEITAIEPAAQPARRIRGRAQAARAWGFEVGQEDLCLHVRAAVARVMFAVDHANVMNAVD